MRSTDEVYGSLAYDGAPLLRVPVCFSKALLVSDVARFSCEEKHRIKTR